MAAWYNTRLERDKGLLTLSAGGVGLLITLLTTVGVSSSEGLVLYVLAILAFLLCVGFVLVIFKKNGSHIEAVIKSGAPLSDPWLRALDNGAIIAFAAGVLLSSAIGVSAAINTYSKVKTMANDSRPQRDFNRSFNGAANLKPSTSPQAGPVSPAGPAVASDPAATTPATAPTQTPAPTSDK